MEKSAGLDYRRSALQSFSQRQQLFLCARATTNPTFDSFVIASLVADTSYLHPNLVAAPGTQGTMAAPPNFFVKNGAPRQSHVGSAAAKVLCALAGVGRSKERNRHVLNNGSDPSAIHYPEKSVCNGRKYLGRRAKNKGKSTINVDHALPAHSQQAAIIWMYEDLAVGAPYVELSR